MSYALLLLDARIDPVSPLPWGALIVLLVIVFVLAVGFAAGIVVLLIWLKRRQIKDAGNKDMADSANFDDLGQS